MWTAILNFLAGLLGLVPKAPTPEAVAERTGEDAGKAKAENAAAQVAIKNAEAAQATRQEIRAETAAEVATGAPPADDGFRRD